MPTVAQLKSEITADPTARGYMAFVNANDFGGAAALINATQGTITVKRIDVMAGEIAEAIDNRDFLAAPNPSHVMLVEASLLQRGPLRFTNEDGTATKILGNIKRLLVADDATHTSRAALDALATRTGSRAEQLWGAGTVITGSDVANALVS